MNEATVKLIEELAAKLGTTAEHLWGVLIKQAPISSICDILALFIFGMGLFLAGKFINKKTSPDENGDRDWDGDGIGVAWLIFSIVTLVYISIALLGFGDIMAGFINPEYWALQKILYSIKN